MTAEESPTVTSVSVDSTNAAAFSSCWAILRAASSSSARVFADTTFWSTTPRSSSTRSSFRSWDITENEYIRRKKVSSSVTMSE